MVFVTVNRGEKNKMSIFYNRAMKYIASFTFNIVSVAWCGPVSCLHWIQLVSAVSK